MIINHNMSAVYANRQLSVNQISLDKNIESLSSGLKISKAGDDASGLAVSEKMRAQIRGLKVAAKNAQDSISFIQTTEGYLESTQNLLQRIRELSIQSANGIYTNEDRMQIQVEVSQLVDEIDRISSHAQFNGINMLTGRFSNGATGAPTSSMWFHIGANMDQRKQVFIGTMTAKGLGLVEDSAGQTGGRRVISLSTPELANNAIGRIDAALQKVNKQRADLGAYQNRMEFAVKGIEIGSENLQAAESRIRDTDMASEMADFTKNQVLSQSTVAMLSQANAKSQSVLQLLR
ncbi:MAG TPA: flagellin [Spirochaetia bacterium]|nr:MAG: flagellin [Spirochaetes bacterium GWB1_36_13]HCL57657.1 flagellin [Spirochaetia bacterium]